MSKTIIIAEAGVNHNGSISLAKELIDIAALAGVDYVKFQTFKAENLVSKEAKKADYQINNTGNGKESQYEMLKRLELSEQDHRVLIDYCKDKGLTFFSTAFDLDSLQHLADIGLTMVKIPSGEITNLPYLRKAAQLFKKVIISTGMATLEEIGDAIKVFTDGGVALSAITVLHCTTEYPAPMNEVNLKAMQAIAERFNVAIGYSDHTEGIEVPIAAVALGASIIEKHFTLNKDMEGPDHKASLEPEELTAMVKGIRNVEMALSGNGLKQPTSSELKNMAIARKSIHILSDLPGGHILSADDLIMKRPGDGISPMKIDEVLNRKLNKSVMKDHKLSMDDLK